MSTTTEERHNPITDEREVVQTRPETREWLGQEVAGHLALIVGLSWYLLFSIAVAIEPAADHPDAIPSWLGNTIDFTLLGVLAVTAGGLITRRRFGLVAAPGAAAPFVAVGGARPLRGPHTFRARGDRPMARADR